MSGPLTEEERSAIFASGAVPVDRSTAFKAGNPPVPRKAILFVVGVFIVLGLGGTVAQHLLGTTPGLGTPKGTAPVADTPVPAPPTPAPIIAPPISASLSAFIGLKSLHERPAPPISLVGQGGTTTSLGDFRGKVVVVTFYNSNCLDICPVLGAEVRQADSLLGANRDKVEMLVVNTDPLQTTPSPNPPAMSQPALNGYPNVEFLNGTLRQLNRVWTEYGVRVTVQQTGHVVNHNGIMYFVDPTGKLRSFATPFANEDRLGTYGLPTAAINRFAQGIDTTATNLLTNS